MAKTLVVVGFGPGNATAVAEKFGAQGFSVAIIGRNEERLAEGVAALKGRGISAAAFVADATDPTAIGSAIRKVRAEVGPISALHWNAYGGAEAGDILTADPVAVHGIFDVAVFGLLAATQEALADLRSAGDGAILITNGAFGDSSPAMDEYVTKSNVMGIALANAAKNKLAGLLGQRLKREGVYVGEVVIYGTVKGTPTGGDNAIDPAIVAGKFWDLYKARGETRAEIH